MNHTEASAVVRELAPMVRRYVADALAPMAARLAAIEARPPIAEPRGITGATIDRSNCLILTLSDGTALNVGAIVGLDGKDGDPGQRGEPGLPGPQGRPGEPGRDGAAGLAGKDGLPGEPGKDGPQGRDGRDGLPGVPGQSGEKGLDGTNGRDGINGKDGLGFDDMSEEIDGDGRTIVRRYRRGDEAKEFRLVTAAVLDRGVFKSGAEYQKGDGVTFGGSFWIAQRDTNEKPETSDAWRLAVKRGRDGKDGAPGAQGPEGVPGKAGRDMTQIAANGARY